MRRKTIIAKNLSEMKKEFEDKPVSEQKIMIGGKVYSVVSHYVGNKDINAVIGDLAERRAYEDIRKSVG